MTEYLFRIRSRLHLCAAPAMMLLAVCALFSPRSAHAADSREAKKIFSQRCSACHTFGKGIKVGPDLKGVTDRRPRPWLLAFIRSSQKVIQSGDTVAAALFQEFKRQQMPDWSDLSEAQVGGILDWFAANGPEQREPDERNAETASAAEIDTGRRLFSGATRLANGGSACSGCHSVRDDGAKSGGSFAPELTRTYFDYQDKALTLFLKRPCFLRMPESAATVYLAPEESFALKAFLRHTALPDLAPAAAPPPEKGAPSKGGAQ